MRILRNIKVPTGNILIVEGVRGKLECLSIGDYGKEANIKADFLGLSREIKGVTTGSILPLEDKWVITISTQYGCSSNCTFCDVPKVGPGINATFDDMLGQIVCALSLHPEVKFTKRLNLHYARMGEPTFNLDILPLTRQLAFVVARYTFHPVISTMLPNRNKHLLYFLKEWMNIKNKDLNGEAGLQFSINSTNDLQRDEMFSNNSLKLLEISALARNLPTPKGRKITLNFALNDTYETDGKKLAKLFSPEHFLVKITPMHMTNACMSNGLKTTEGYSEYYPYAEAEQSFKESGFDVIVFIPSEDEDRSRITCGNAILSDEVIK